MPRGYQRIGTVLLLRLPPKLAPYRRLLGEAWQEELGVETVLARTGPIDGELRHPRVERLAGDTTVTEVVEHGVRWRLDAARVMFAAGNRTERRRVAGLVRPGERIADLFAGIGYFAIPAALALARVSAVEKNPIAYRYLVENAARNGVQERLEPHLGDNRDVPLPRGAYDRVFLGYLPSAVPWIGRALELAAPEGATLHVHLVVDARGALPRAREEVAAEVARRGAQGAGPARARAVKPYGPGRTHVVVDAPVRTG